jgi:hypothetical protein
MSLSSRGKKRWQHQEGWYRERWTVGSVGKYLYRLALYKTEKKSHRRVLEKINKIYLLADTIGWDILALYRALSYHII